jgi:integrase
MRVLIGVIKNRHGVHCARRKVPPELAGAVARLTGSARERQSWLQRSLRTKDSREANIRAKPVLIEFDRILEKAKALAGPRKLRIELSDSEIKRISDFFYATSLEEDDLLRSEDDSEGLYQSVNEQLEKAGQLSGDGFPKASVPKFGLSDRQMQKRGETLAIVSAAAKEALARNDLSFVADEVAGLLEDFRIDLDTSSLAYRKLGAAVLRRYVAALKVKTDRHHGESIETPVVQQPSPQSTASGSLTAALEGWKKYADRPVGTLREFEHAVSRFIQLHGDLPIASINRRHVREFREALQAMPVRRTGRLREATLSQLLEWSQRHPEAQRISPGTVNKLLGAVQAISVWGRDNGLVPDDSSWADAFSGMRLEEQEPEREPWEIDDLKKLFASDIYALDERPKGVRGEAAYWLPLLGLFTGARLGELALLLASDVSIDEASGVSAISIADDPSIGRSLKTRASRRTVPVHPELIRLGFLEYVRERRDDEGSRARLFSSVARKSDVASWSKWFGRYIRQRGIDRAVFHSFRHGFADALRAAGESRDIRRALTGHSGEGTDEGYGAKAMVRRYGLTRLAEAVAKVSYPGLDLSQIRPESSVVSGGAS